MDLFRASWTLRPSLMPYSRAGRGGHLSSPSVEPGRPRGDKQGITCLSQRIRSPEPLPKLDLRFPRATKLAESPLSQSSKYHLDGNLRISRALSIGLICARYRILALCQSRSSWRPTETRDDTFMGPGKQRISERSLWWTVKRTDTMNNSLD